MYIYILYCTWTSVNGSLNWKFYIDNLLSYPHVTAMLTSKGHQVRRKKFMFEQLS